MAALQDPLNQFFIQLSGGMKDSACLSSIHDVARPAALHRVCTLMNRAVKEIHCFSASYGAARPAALLGVCTLLGRAVRQLP